MRLLRLVVLSVLGASFLLACGSDDEKGGGGGSGGSTGGACVPTAAECYQAGPTGPGAECLAKADNTGKDVTLSARGSSVKLDKADGVVLVKRTDDGVRLTTTHARTSSYVRELTLNVTGTDGTAPISFTVSPFAWPAGTLDAVALLDSLGVPATAGRPACLAALKAAGEGVRTEVLAAAIRWRKGSGTPPGTRLGNTSGEHP